MWTAGRAAPGPVLHLLSSSRAVGYGQDQNVTASPYHSLTMESFLPSSVYLSPSLQAGPPSRCPLKTADVACLACLDAAMACSLMVPQSFQELSWAVSWTAGVVVVTRTESVAARGAICMGKMQLTCTPLNHPGRLRRPWASGPCVLKGLAISPGGPSTCRSFNCMTWTSSVEAKLNGDSPTRAFVGGGAFCKLS